MSIVKKAQKQAIVAEANRKRSEAAKGRERSEDGTLKPGPVLQQNVVTLEANHRKGQSAKAAASGLSPRAKRSLKSELSFATVFVMAEYRRPQERLG